MTTLDGVHADRLAGLQLLVSELITASVVHAVLRPSDAIELSIFDQDDKLRVEVSGAGAEWLSREMPAARGTESDLWSLKLVAAVASRWGGNVGARTRVWFELAA
ncbi:MAG: Histidine kinaselike ATPase domain [Thermoleophilaceae bacterium]|nr:Histidine kinaselike ATPase domain [Thermoleophilaceae bacterium]